MSVGVFQGFERVVARCGPWEREMGSTIPVSGGLGHQNVEDAGTHAFHQASLIVQHQVKGVDTLRPTSEGLKNPPK